MTMQNSRPVPTKIENHSQASPARQNGDVIVASRDTVPHPIVLDHGSTPPLPTATPFKLGSR